MKITLSLAVSFMILSSGCVLSHNPVYTEGNLIFNPYLLGCWEREIGETWHVSKANHDKNDKKYKLINYRKKRKIGEFDLYLLQIEDQIFIDLFPVPRSEIGEDFPQIESKLDDPSQKIFLFYNWHWLYTDKEYGYEKSRRAHTFYNVSQIRPNLVRIRFPSNYEGRLGKFIQVNPISYEGPHDIVLSASIEELQKFLLKAVDTRVFSKPLRFKRYYGADC